MTKEKLVAMLWTLVFSNCLYAAPAILSDEFTGDEPQMFNQFLAGSPVNLSFRALGPITFSKSAIYNFKDARKAFHYDVSFSIHSGNFDSNNPDATEVIVLDDFGDVDLQAGVAYTFVFQPYDDFYENNPNAFGLIIDGLGEISGENISQLPDQYFGHFEFGGSKVMTIPAFEGCPETYYDVVGPIRAPRAGWYYFATMSNMVNGPGMVLSGSIHEGSWDPADPQKNQTYVFPDSARFFMLRDTDYYIVVQPDCEVKTGEWSFVIAPPKDTFHWTSYVSSIWADPDTLGAGVLFDILTETKAVFLAWFTWATQLPDPGLPSDSGDAGTRWMVAFGTYEEVTDRVIEMDVYFPTGGLFNQAPATDQPKAGTMTLDMSKGCEGGVMHYKLDSGLEGSTDLSLIVNDTLKLCTEQGMTPGVYEPLEIGSGNE